LKVNLVYDVKSFVLENGNVLDKLRIAAAGYEIPEETTRELIAIVRAIMNEDGGVPFDVKPGAPSSAKTTAEILTLLIQLGWDVGNLVDRMVKFLVSRQKNDGGFAETMNLNSYIEDKFGATEGREWYPVGKSITWLTGKALEALCLAKYEDEERLRRARDFLLYNQYEDGHWPDYVGHAESDPLGTGNILPALRAVGVSEDNEVYVNGRAALFQHLKHSIESGFTFDMVDLAAVVPPKTDLEREIVVQGIELIVRTQRSDGGWCVVGSKKSNPDLSAQLALVVKRCAETV